MMLAILAKDVPAPANNPSGPVFPEFPTSADDPDRLVLLFSNAALSCQSPTMTCGADSVWETVMSVPSDLVRVGPIDLGNPRVTLTEWQLFGGEMGMCGGGGGGAGEGTPPAPGKTLEIVSTDSGSISIKLSGGLTAGLETMMNGMWTSTAVSLDGPWTGSRCEPAPTAPPPKAAVAIKGSSLPAGLPSNPTIGTTVDPTALYVFLGTGTQTCMAPLPDLGCAGAGRITLRIPAALQQPGTINLSDPQLAASFEITPPTGTSNCTPGPSGSFSQGTLTISSADASGLTFTLYQSAASGQSVALLDADGLYQATICP
jgi:hypothetical protein